MTSSDDVSQQQSSRLPVLGFVLLAALGPLWGLNWPLMKMALVEIPVWWYRAMTVCIGAMGLLAISFLANGTIRLPRSDFKALAGCVVFNIVGWHMFTGYGVSLMPAGRASIIAFTMPVWAAILGTYFLGEAMTRYKVAGLILGVLGLALLIGPDLIVLQTAPLGALFMLGAAISWAIGTVLFKKHNWSTPVAAIAGWQLVGGALVITPGAMMLEPVPDLTTLSTNVMLGLVYLLAIPMVFCQWAYFKVVSIFPAAVAAIGTLLVPVVGVYSSAFMLGEHVGWQEFAAMSLICGALLCVLILPALKSATAKR